MDNKQIKNNLMESYNRHAQDREAGTLETWKIESRSSFLALLQREGKLSLLEIGAGTGKDSKFFQENGMDVTCIDLSAEMVKLCRQKGLSAQIMDMAHLEFTSESFDVIYTFNSLLHIPKNELSPVLENIKRVLKPNGLFHLGIYGSENEFEGIWEEDSYVPKRFFVFYSDEHIKEIATQHFELISFDKIISEGNHIHFQRLILRKS